MVATHTEEAFEAHIADAMVASGGWERGDPRAYDRQTRLVPSALWRFIEATQPHKLERLETVFGATYRRDVERLLARELDKAPARVLHLLRHGFEVRSVRLDLAYFAPAHGLTPELEARFRENILTVVRQLPHSRDHRDTLDLALFVNGLGVASAELKNSLTGQTVEHAKAQYRRDRDPRDPFLSRRCVVHFAVDTDVAFMTTRIAGDATHFLPFNRGSAPDGRGGAGNPPPAAGDYATSYLWLQVWRREAFLDILNRFIHVEEGDEDRASSIIFPRYHQWDAVVRVAEAARAEGAGHPYLVMHSAGSGKTNSIGWLAHRLASLHGDDDEVIFHKVVVITDRRVLDRQLQVKIQQFEKRAAAGLVATIDAHSSQLTDALRNPGAKIIVTTLQKFPHILDEVRDLPDRRYAVLIDEAHSSQSGETSKQMKQALSSARGDSADSDAALLDAAAEAEARYVATTGEDDINAAVEASAAARRRQSNLSMFAFTATPKAKTVELFGRPTAELGEDGRPLRGPFHLYSMRQAIEEGFILDVLAAYMTYAVYYRLSVAGQDLEVQRSKAAVAAARYASLHPYALGQKAEIIVEHFRERTAAEISGRAKAMVVTRSRLHAVRFKQAIDAYVTAKGYTGVAALVAFSGEVVDPDAPADTPYTESNMNGFPDTQTARRFSTDDYQVMVVAEKFQTGFDQPLLQAMFVDKKLDGVNAVQTLSRLNRTAPGKESTFVLDFVNDAESIREAFRPYYQVTLATETEPERLTDAWSRLDAHLVVEDGDVEAFARVWFAVSGPDDRSAQARLYATLVPCEDRFGALEATAQDEFRSLLASFVRMYAFVSQIITYTDTTMEKRYALARMLAHRLRDQSSPTLDLGDDVRMTFLRMERSEALDLSLSEGSGELTAFTGDGAPRATQEELSLLSEVIEALNERFGTAFTEADAIKFESLAAQMSADEVLREQARANTLENFRHAFDARLTTAIVEWMSHADDLAVRMLDDEEFAKPIADLLARMVHRQASTTAS
jgi:type I restriction enzyme R subunit